MVGGSEKGNPQRPEVRRKRKSTGMRDLYSLPAELDSGSTQRLRGENTATAERGSPTGFWDKNSQNCGKNFKLKVLFLIVLVW